MATKAKLKEMFEGAEEVSASDFEATGGQEKYFPSLTGGRFVLVKEGEVVRTQSLSTLQDYMKLAAQVGATNIRKYKFQ